MTLQRSGFRFLSVVLVILASLWFSRPEQAEARVQLWLPTPVGEEWIILQGYQCGSHVGNQSLSLDLVSLRGRTRGAPVRAAASGTTFVWEGRTGTLILAHGGGYYTMYTHMQRPITTARGVRVRQGQQIGEVGSVGTGVAHLHFNYFYAPDSGAYRRTLLPLSFADGYDFPKTSGCSQHFGKVVVAKDIPDTIPPTVSFSSDIQPDTWLCEDRSIAFTVQDDQAVLGFSQAIDTEPDATAPEFQGDAGFIQASWMGEGMHMLSVRAWDDSGNQSLTTFGPIGYDATPPAFNLSSGITEKTYPFQDSVYLEWNQASDGNGSGIAGYAYVLSSDPSAVSEQVVEHHGATFSGMQPGTYLLRVQAIDRACNRSDWQTVQKIHITGPAQDTIPTATPTSMPTIKPTSIPTSMPTAAPIISQTMQPTNTPTSIPTTTPIISQTMQPTNTPTSIPTTTPIISQTMQPTSTPTRIPTATPIISQTMQPTNIPSTTPVGIATGDTAGDASDAPIDEVKGSEGKERKDDGEGGEAGSAVEIPAIQVSTEITRTSLVTVTFTVMSGQ